MKMVVQYPSQNWPLDAATDILTLAMILPRTNLFLPSFLSSQDQDLKSWEVASDWIDLGPSLYPGSLKELDRKGPCPLGIINMMKYLYFFFILLNGALIILYFNNIDDYLLH